ncbi:MAG: Sua5/YciO/YrdC/YwlC family protein [Pseudomonadota bacterium]
MPRTSIAFRVRHVLRRGGVIAYPTEGVFGLGCDPRVHAALVRLLGIKGRDADKGLILLAAHAAQLNPWLDPSVHSDARLVPGTRATTWIMPASADCPPLLTGGRDTLAVRVTDHPVARALSLLLDAPLVSTSANLSGKPAIRNGFQLRRTFGARIDAVIDRPLGTQTRASRIIDGNTGQVLRD